MEGLTPGRMVHYVMRGQANVNPAGDKDDGARGQHRAAVVTYVKDDVGTVDLCVFSRGMPDGFGGQSPTFAVRDVSFANDGGAVNTWHWIERA